MRSEIAIKASRNEARVPLLRHALENYTRVFNRLAGTDWTARRLLLVSALAWSGILLAVIPCWWTLALAAAAATACAAGRKERKGGAR